jgi:hypothetical protein
LTLKFLIKESAMFQKSSHAPQRIASLPERLADSLDHIKRTEGKWFDGTLESIESRKSELRSAMTMARQARSGREVTQHALAAMEIEQALEKMYTTADRASQNFVSEEIVEAQRELPHYRINVMDY